MDEVKGLFQCSRLMNGFRINKRRKENKYLEPQEKGGLSVELAPDLLWVKR
ncbi:hypothetical protein [Sporolactobacillus putidus]|uniref:Uncharacterized protein n=1 Tax=Sporolactobacillus putidus TaxID=492735 RepID=A0A917W2F0_9BACL|nr:hypothetical protein [Sporolactobacillus putidus]GGL61186.1 hypothetical protein GCM10007968_26460 [Sporolactobacillus putidus]